MKKWIKVLFFVMAVSYMLAFAIVVEQGGVMFFERNWDNMGVYVTTEAPKIEKIQIDEKVKQIQITASQENIVVETSKTETHEVTVKMVGERPIINQPSFAIAKQGEHVVIQVQDNTKKNMDIIGINDSKVLVTLPASYKGTLSVATETGNLELNSTFTNKITVTSQTGNIKLLGISTNKELEVKNNTGNVALTLLKVDNFDLDVRTKTGNISLPAMPMVSLSDGQKEVACQRGTGGTHIVIRTTTGNVEVK